MKNYLMLFAGVFWGVTLAFAAFLWCLLVLVVGEIISNKSVSSIQCVVLFLEVRNLELKPELSFGSASVSKTYATPFLRDNKWPLFSVTEEPQQVWASEETIYLSIRTGKLGQGDPDSWQLTECAFDKKGLAKICTDHYFNRHGVGECKRDDNL